MTNFLKSRNLYKLIVFIFLIIAIIKIKNQFVTLQAYNSEIAMLEEKKAVLEEQLRTSSVNSNHSRKDNEDLARKDLKMYYPDETPYKGYWFMFFSIVFFWTNIFIF